MGGNVLRVWNASRIHKVIFFQISLQDVEQRLITIQFLTIVHATTMLVIWDMENVKKTSEEVPFVTLISLLHVQMLQIARPSLEGNTHGRHVPGRSSKK